MLPPRPTDKFVLPRCESCGKFHFYPRPVCPHCQDARIAWAEASGRGTVYSHSTVHRAPSAEFRDGVPYVIAIVATEEGPHLLSRIVGVSPDAVKIGMRVRVRLDKVGDIVLPVFGAEA